MVYFLPVPIVDLPQKQVAKYNSIITAVIIWKCFEATWKSIHVELNLDIESG